MQPNPLAKLALKEVTHLPRVKQVRAEVLMLQAAAPVKLDQTL